MPRCGDGVYIQLWLIVVKGGDDIVSGDTEICRMEGRYVMPRLSAKVVAVRLAARWLERSGR